MTRRGVRVVGAVTGALMATGVIAVGWVSSIWTLILGAGLIVGVIGFLTGLHEGEGQ